MFYSRIKYQFFSQPKRESNALRGTQRSYKGPFNDSVSNNWEVHVNIRVATIKSNLLRFGHLVLVGKEDMNTAITNAVQTLDGSLLSNHTIEYRSVCTVYTTFGQNYQGSLLGT